MPAQDGSQRQDTPAAPGAQLPDAFRPPRVALWKPPLPTAQQCRRGLVVLLSGVQGGCWPLRGVVLGVRDAGEQRAICIFRWQVPGLGIANLWARGHQAAAARRLRDAIQQFRDRFARPPVDVIAYSAGAVVALRAVAGLPRCGDVRHLLLVQPAVSPRYPLDAALGGLCGKLVVFVSRRDRLLLGLGTGLFGTADGVHGPAAGRVGFDLERCVAETQQRRRVEQVPWTPAMARSGHAGGHLGCLRRAWTRDWVAPRLG